MVVVTDPAKRAAIAEIYRSIGAEYLVHAEANAEDPQTRRVYRSAQSLTETLAQVPVHVIPCLLQPIDANNPLVAAYIFEHFIPRVDVRNELHSTHGPSLVCSGRHDWVTPVI